jgi:hypothetical protein
LATQNQTEHEFLRLLRDGKVATVKTGNARYAAMLPGVAEIKIALVKEV